MKKNIIFILVLVLLISGCTPRETESNNEEPTNEENIEKTDDKFTYKIDSNTNSKVVLIFSNKLNLDSVNKKDFIIKEKSGNQNELEIVDILIAEKTITLTTKDQKDQNIYELIIKDIEDEHGNKLDIENDENIISFTGKNNSEDENIKEEKDQDDEKKNEDIEDKKQNNVIRINNIDFSLDDLLNNKSAWDYDYKDKRINIEYSKPKYDAKADQYNFDLEKIDNPDQFTGFTNNQKEMLEKNGFVVLKPKNNNPKLKIHQVYEGADYDNLPTFITADAVLNMYHIFYSGSMKYLEASNYHPKLVSMTKSLLKKSLVTYKDADSNVKEELKTAVLYFSVAGELLDIKADLPTELRKIVDLETKKINNAKDKKRSEVFDKEVDYTQFKVRGHYTISKNFKRYFKAMMWYGQSGFEISKINDNGEEIIYEDKLIKSLMITNLVMSGGKKDLDSWIDIYDLTSLYSGTSDDLNLLDFKNLIEKVYGKGPKFKEIDDEKYKDKLVEEVKNMRNKQIVPKFAGKNNKGKEFRLMGQRYTLDANIMQELVKPFKRPLPTAFDVLSAFNHKRAEKILHEYYKPNEKWDGYNDRLADMKKMVNNLDQSFWKKDLYHGWLWSIDSAAKSFENNKNMPPFMQNEPWSHKSISAALGSFTELKYDNILYSKQAVAEMGGPVEAETLHYVEPNVELYSRLNWLIKYTKANLEQKIDVDKRELEVLNRMSNILDVLINCSVKELQNEDLSEDELKSLKHIGGLIDNINFDYMGKMREYTGDYSDEDSTAIIADVATAQGHYREESLGIPLEIYVIVKVNGKTVLTKGSVYSYYEFISKERLTTDKWYEMIGLKQEENEYHTRTIYTGEKTDILEKMPWMKSYISPDENNVESKSPEVSW
ncbi:MAG: DUF3160 domain-containing protein [Bacillota bacterium]